MHVNAEGYRNLSKNNYELKEEDLEEGKFCSNCCFILRMHKIQDYVELTNWID